MGFLWWKRKDNRINHDLTEEDRQLSLEIRQTRAEIKKLELEREAELARLEFQAQKLELEQEIAEMKGEEPNGDMNNIFMNGILSPVLQRLTNPQMPGGSNKPPTMPGVVDLTTEQIKGFIEQVPKNYRKQAKNLDHLQLTNIIKGYIPNISDKSLNETISLLKNS